VASNSKVVKGFFSQEGWRCAWENHAKRRKRCFLDKPDEIDHDMVDVQKKKSRLSAINKGVKQGERLADAFAARA